VWGKTTTIGKLAYQFKQAGKKCIWLCRHVPRRRRREQL
jgi:signal recognition particle GTPase